MTETLAGVDLSNTENLLEEKSLAEAAVVGVSRPTQTLGSWSTWRSRRKPSSQ